jgi:hypothetical protein
VLRANIYLAARLAAKKAAAAAARARLAALILRVKVDTNKDLLCAIALSVKVLMFSYLPNIPDLWLDPMVEEFCS